MSDEYSVVPLSLSPASVAMPRKDDNNVIVSSGPARRITQLRVIASAIPPPSPSPPSSCPTAIFSITRHKGRKSIIRKGPPISRPSVLSRRVLYSRTLLACRDRIDAITVCTSDPLDDSEQKTKPHAWLKIRKSPPSLSLSLSHTSRMSHLVDCRGGSMDGAVRKLALRLRPRHPVKDATAFAKLSTGQWPIFRLLHRNREGGEGGGDGY